MNVDQVMQYITRLPGVAGAFIVNSSGNVLSKEIPVIFDDNSIEVMTVDGGNALETLRAEMPSCFELRIDLSLMTVLIRDLSGDLLFVLVDQAKEMSAIRIAANVTSKRYSPDDSSVGGAGEPSSSTGLLSLSPAKKEKPVKKEKPSSGGSIWG